MGRPTTELVGGWDEPAAMQRETIYLDVDDKRENQEARCSFP